LSNKNLQENPAARSANAHVRRAALRSDRQFQYHSICIKGHEMKSLKRTGGFTLIELMIVVVIVAVLAAVAYPSYQDSVRKGRRSAAQTLLTEIANKQQQQLADTRTYALGATNLAALMANMGYSSLPKDVNGFYTVDSCPSPATAASVPCGTTATTPPSFTLIATPVAGGPQVSDGALTLDNLGAKTRNGAGGW
jgi:type IV pilus assembly protein PilE